MQKPLPCLRWPRCPGAGTVLKRFDATKLYTLACQVGCGGCVAVSGHAKAACRWRQLESGVQARMCAVLPPPTHPGALSAQTCRTLWSASTCCSSWPLWWWRRWATGGRNERRRAISCSAGLLLCGCCIVAARLPSGVVCQYAQHTHAVPGAAACKQQLSQQPAQQRCPALPARPPAALAAARTRPTPRCCGAACGSTPARL